MLFIFRKIISNRSQNAIIDGCRSKLVDGVMTDDSTFMAVVPLPGVRVRVAEPLNRDLGKVNEWCDQWENKFKGIVS